MRELKKIKASTVLTALILVMCANNLHAQNNQNSEIIKIGYYENEVFQEGAQPGQIKKGYAYEYYRKLSEYTGWKYEYVYGNFSDLYSKLEAGEIDLLAGLAYTTERAKKIFYEDLPMGSTQYYLLKKHNSYDISPKISSLNGKKIGVQDSVMVQILNKWVKEHDVNADIIVYKDIGGLFSAFDKDELDIVMVESSGTYGRQDTAAFLCVGSTDYYLCVSRNRPDILSTLNNAHSQLNTEDSSFLNLLYSKYFSRSIASTTFSEGELDYLKTHNSINIGYLNNYLPYCTTTPDGNLNGFLKDVIAEQWSKLDLNESLKVNYQSYEKFSDLVEDLNNGKIDVAFPVGGGLYFSEESGFYQSQPVINTSVAMVYNGDYNKNRKPIFAVNKNNDMQYFYIKTNFPDAVLEYYDSINACLDAIAKNKADFTTINGLRVNQLLKNTRYKKLKYRLLAQTDERCYGVRIGNENLLHLLNRGINSIGEQFILNQAYPYTDELFQYTIADYLKNVLFVVIPLLFIVGIIIVLYSLRTKSTLKTLNVQLKRALENRERYITDMIRYASSEADADKILDQLVEYIGKNTDSDRVYVFEENKNHTYDNTYEWCNEGITREKENLQNVPYEGVLEVWLDEFKKNGHVTVRDIDSYKEVSEAIYEILKPQQIQTLAAVPLSIRGKIIGFLGVDNPPVKDINDVAEFLKLVEFFFSLMIRLRNGMTTLQESAVHDQLTGCKNRKALVWAYNNDFDKKQTISVVAIDLNGLKQINDTNGHEAGDKYICRMADSLSEVFGHENVYRMGGDEFTVILLGKTKSEFDNLVKTYQFMTGNTAASGYIHEETAELDFSEILKKADAEMYKAKDDYYKDRPRYR